MKAWSLSRRNDAMNVTLWTTQDPQGSQKLNWKLKETFVQMKEDLPQGNGSSCQLRLRMEERAMLIKRCQYPEILRVENSKWSAQKVRELKEAFAKLQEKIWNIIWQERKQETYGYMLKLPALEKDQNLKELWRFRSNLEKRNPVIEAFTLQNSQRSRNFGFTQQDKCA